jgi:hypothetical protein
MSMRCVHVCAALWMSALGVGCVVLPAAPPEASLSRVSLDQGWNDAERRLFDHQTQGSVIIPYEWFVALEQPEIKFIGSVGLFRDPEYLVRFGFLQDVASVGASEATLVASHCRPKTSPATPPSDPDYNCGLPVGISRGLELLPDTGERQDSVGFTCAGCHTSELHHGGTAIRIAGASNPLEVTQFQSALGAALLLTQRLPFRFTRFADRVLQLRGLTKDSPEYGPARDTLRAGLDDFLSASTPELVTTTVKRLYANHPGGFGRTDAFARIGNLLFGFAMKADNNLVVGDAPVKFPSVWDAPYFAWAQYNGSIEQSMVRNVGEALGVRVRIDYKPGGKEWGQSGQRQSVLTTSIDIPGLYSIETLLRGTGTDYFNGLRSPIWPEAYLGRIAWDRVERGRQLYQNRCQGCHLAPIADLVEVAARPDGTTGLRPRGDSVYAVPGNPASTRIGLELPVPGGPAGSKRMFWIANNHPEMLSTLRAAPFETTEFFLNFETVDLGSIRTDPGEALSFAHRLIDTGEILLPSFPQYNGPSANPVRMTTMGTALQMVAIDLTTQFYDRVDAMTAAERAAFVGRLPANLLARDPKGAVLLDAAGNPQAAAGVFNADGTINRDEWNGYRVPAASGNIGYRPHPLNGIWASPPYLHNASVPNLYELLSPYEERSKVFYTGTREYDLDRIGYRSGRLRGGFRYDTSVTGNSNYGHLFQQGEPGNGIIGPYLTPDDRRAIIEFLKTLCPPGTQTDVDGKRLCQPLPGLSSAR